MRATAPPMRGAFVPFVVLGLAVSALSARAGAQARCRPLCAPVVLLQPGFISEDVAGDASPETDFNLRVVTAIPTFITRTRVIAAVQWPPFREIGGVTVNSPTVLYGPVFTLLNSRQFALELNVLGEYGPARIPEEAVERRYAHALLLQADAVLKAGALWTDIESRWRDLGVYAMLGYRATGIGDEASPWVLLTGVTIPITP